MKEVVDSFYRDVQIKICSIKKRQKREIRDMIKELKRMTVGKNLSSNGRKIWKSQSAVMTQCQTGRKKSSLID